METTEYIWMDGKLEKWEDSKIHILTHTLHYGSGVFEGIRVYDTSKGPAIFRLKEHVERLFNSAKSFGIQVDYSIEEIEKAIIDTVKANKLKDGYIRPLIYFGYGKMGLATDGAKVNVSISCWPWPAYFGDKALRVKTSSFIRIHPKSSIQEAKISGHYINSILAHQEAHSHGYDEALMLGYNGKITEGSAANFFILKDGKMYTPPAGNILIGITRNSVIQIARDLGIEVIEKDLVLEDAYSADEAFFTGTAVEIAPIESIDDKKLKENSEKIAYMLKEKYSNIVRGKEEKYLGWLTYA